MGKEFASGSGIACQVGSEKSGSYHSLLFVSASTGQTAPSAARRSMRLRF